MRRLVWVATFAAGVGYAAAAHGAPKVPGSPAAKLGKAAKKGLDLAKSGDCVSAVPVLEIAETEDHRPVTAAALAGCHISLGELVLAHEIYGALAKETPKASWDATDKTAVANAKKAAAELDARIPRVTLEVTPAGASYEVKIAGVKTEGSPKLVRVPPDEKTEVEILAEGYEPKTASVLLTERESKTLQVALVKLGDKPGGNGTEPPKGKPEQPKEPVDDLPKHWLGARFRGIYLPIFLMNAFADGGSNAYFPGVGVTYTARLETVDIEPSIVFTSYGLPTTRIKPTDRPNTEWEIMESDLWGVAATLDILYRVRVSAEVEVRIGAGFGVGWAFTGDIYRWQAYPTGDPEDESTYEKCNAPNDPPGSFRYCNQLDKDAERYGQPDKTWADGGLRPVVYPWLALPELSFAFRPVPRVAIDLGVGVTLNGLSTDVALRFGL